MEGQPCSVCKMPLSANPKAKNSVQNHIKRHKQLEEMLRDRKLQAGDLRWFAFPQENKKSTEFICPLDGKRLQYWDLVDYLIDECDAALCEDFGYGIQFMKYLRTRKKQLSDKGVELKELPTKGDFVPEPKTKETVQTQKSAAPIQTEI